MRTLPETRARSSQEAGKRARKLSRYKANQACKNNLLVSATGLVRLASRGRKGFDFGIGDKHKNLLSPWRRRRRRSAEEEFTAADITVVLMRVGRSLTDTPVWFSRGEGITGVVRGIADARNRRCDSLSGKCELHTCS